LALATPSKKERPSPPGPSSTVKLHRSSPAPTPKPVETHNKPKKEKLLEPPRPAALNDQTLPSFKGKEKEIAAPSPTPTPTQTKQNKQRKIIQSTPINVKKCKDLVKALVRLPESELFLRPVDVVLDGCPTYYDEIEHPMDFGTISSKLNDEKYVTMEEFKHDVELVFSNCRQFNPIGTSQTICAAVVEKLFKKEWPKAMERKLSWTEKRGLQGILTTLVKEQISWVFREPVDPVALGIPTYFDVIPRKDARDLRTIRQKLDSDKYDTVEAFEADVEMMLQNAVKFNGEDSEVGLIVLAVRERFETLLTSWKSGATKKRKDGDNATPQPAPKKVKIG